MVRRLHIRGTEVGDPATRAACYVDGARSQHHPKSAQNIPAVFFQGVGCIDRRAKSPPGRESRPAEAAAPPSPAGAFPWPSSPDSPNAPVPEILNPRGCPSSVFDATCTVAPGSRGFGLDSNPLPLPAANCIVLGSITTKC